MSYLGEQCNSSETISEITPNALVFSSSPPNKQASKILPWRMTQIINEFIEREPQNWCKSLKLRSKNSSSGRKLQCLSGSKKPVQSPRCSKPTLPQEAQIALMLPWHLLTPQGLNTVYEYVYEVLNYSLWTEKKVQIIIHLRSLSN